MAGIESKAHNLGRDIRKARIALRLSQKMLGTRCNVQRAQISKVEKDVKHASMELFLRICDALKMDVYLQEQPLTEEISRDEKSEDEILREVLSQYEILGDLSQNALKALYNRARKNMEERHAPYYTYIPPTIGAEMVELFEADRR